MSGNDKVCFVIAHKYFRGYPSYLKYYVDNIIKFYPKASIIIVDNDSAYKEDVFRELYGLSNITFLENKSSSKFEIGAYTVGLDYILHEGFEKEIDYFVFSQDNFVLKKKYEFSQLHTNNVKACSIVNHRNDWAFWGICSKVLKSINLLDDLIYKCKLCWCNSFVVSKDKVMDLQNILKNIKIVTNHDRQASERYLGRILFELNNQKVYTLDKEHENLSYYCHTVTVNDTIDEYFCKLSQQKTEYTKDQ